MLAFLERILSSVPSGSSARRDERHHLAAAALLVEAARADGHFSTDERRQIELLLTERFSVPPVQLNELMREAELASEVAADWQGFTRVLNDALDVEGRIAVLEMLWEVIDSDGRVDTLEASLMRRLPALLYVSDRDNAEARQRARERLATPLPRDG